MNKYNQHKMSIVFNNECLKEHLLPKCNEFKYTYTNIQCAKWKKKTMKILRKVGKDSKGRKSLIIKMEK